MLVFTHEQSDCAYAISFFHSISSHARTVNTCVFYFPDEHIDFMSRDCLATKYVNTNLYINIAVYINN